jgi:HEAT repeat protein
MYNYYTGLVLKIDLILLAALVFLSIAIIIFALAKELILNRRNKALANIKRHVYELTLSGQKISDNVCIPFASEISARQFLDVATNRNRDTVFFNEAEQKIFKTCFLSPDKIAKIEKIAKSSPNKWHRIEAILSLGYAGNNQVLDILKSVINRKDEDVVYFSIIALGQIKTIPSARILLEFLRTHKFYRYKTVSVLESFPPVVADEAIKMIKDQDDSVRLWVVRLLSGLRPAQYLKEIELLTEDISEEVRAAACECLGAIGKKESRETLINCLKDDFWLVRVEAIRALSKVLGKDCIQEIVSSINDPSLSVIDSVKSVMAEHVDSALPYIEGFLCGEDEVSKKAGLEVIEISGYVEQLLKHLLKGSEKEKHRAIRLLEGMIKAHAHSVFEAALADMEESDRRKLLEIIKGIDQSLAEHIAQKIDHLIEEP